MKKNGFTLIELLASIVILGVLMMVALPNVFRIMTESRQDTYLSDAKKLISNAEYKLRTNSDYITKPKNNNCVVMTMSYLDGPEFDTAPEGGQYNKEYSYVVIKRNTDGTYTYYVSLIEDMNAARRERAKNKAADGDESYKNIAKVYKGISLTVESDLKKKNARSLVKPFKKNEIKNVKNISRTASNVATGCNPIDNATSIYLHSLDPEGALEEPS